MSDAKAYVRHQVLVNGGSNAVFNALFAWLFVKSREEIPVLHAEGVALDFPATALILTLIVSWIVVPLQRKKFAAGTAPLLESPSMFSRLPHNASLLGLVLGLIAALLFVPPALLALSLAGIEALTPLQFALLKGAWAGVLAACIVVPMLHVACLNREQVAAKPA